MLADRISSIASKIISPNQTAFVKGRKIHQSIGLASECFNLLDNKTYGGNLALKVDIAKAFETIDWGFLLHVLDAFGFNNTFQNWVTALLKSAHLSVRVPIWLLFLQKRS